MLATQRLLFRPGSDTAVVGAAFAHGTGALLALDLAAATDGWATRGTIALLLGFAMCWGSNTVSHIHLHRPLFRSATANRLFSLYLTVLLAVPQRWWKLRHLAHHGLLVPGTRPPGLPRMGVDGALEVTVMSAVLGAAALGAPAFFAGVVVPALIVGYGLCAIQGRQEHARAAAGVDHHGRLYNLLWFNDGFHAAHHRDPCAHWTALAAGARATDTTSRMPPVLRWTERWFDHVSAIANRIAAGTLDGIEGITMGLPFVRRFLLRTHGRAFGRLLTTRERARIRTVTVIGGALFPRTTLALAPLLPDARFTIVDRAENHIPCARRLVDEAGIGDRVTFSTGSYDPDCATACDLLVVPLAFRGDRARFYRDPPTRLVAVHDWIWRRRRTDGSARIATLAKRINLARRADV